MFKKLGHTPPKLPQRNKSEHKHYSHYYDDESVQLVSKMFNKDLKFFDTNLRIKDDKKHYRKCKTRFTEIRKCPRKNRKFKR